MVSGTPFACRRESVWDPEEVCKNVCKNGSAKGAKVGCDLRTLCELTALRCVTSAKLALLFRGLQTRCSPS